MLVTCRGRQSKEEAADLHAAVVGLERQVAQAVAKEAGGSVGVAVERNHGVVFLQQDDSISGPLPSLNDY